MNNFNLESYLSDGVEKIIKDIIKASFSNPMTSIFMVQYMKDSRKARKIRIDAEKIGEHTPPFLIASITSKCNLHCKGCYARANSSCSDDENGFPMQLGRDKWKEIFDQAAELGIGFILLAGGEPFLRTDVLKVAGEQRKIIFPIFTNGTLVDKYHLEILSKNRNLVPILSIEGNKETTDFRRGEGTYGKLNDTMKFLSSKGILFGASITISKTNMEESMSVSFLEDLKSKGCKAVIYVEYVPVEGVDNELAFEDADRDYVTSKLDKLRDEEDEMLFISFPGDEKSSGGCLAAGRGFFHINPYGQAEPCPFSPYSDSSLKDMTLKEALKSPLFLKLQESGSLLADHIGGCVLFEQEEKVKELLRI